MEDKRCPVFVDGKECGRELTEVDREAKKIARYDLATYECSLRSSRLFSARAAIEARPSDMTREEVEKQMMN